MTTFSRCERRFGLKKKKNERDRKALQANNRMPVYIHLREDRGGKQKEEERRLRKKKKKKTRMKKKKNLATTVSISTWMESSIPAVTPTMVYVHSGGKERKRKKRRNESRRMCLFVSLFLLHFYIQALSFSPFLLQGFFLCLVRRFCLDIRSRFSSLQLLLHLQSENLLSLQCMHVSIYMCWYLSIKTPYYMNR